MRKQIPAANLLIMDITAKLAEATGADIYESKSQVPCTWACEVRL